ncbi:MAG: hypothetical protein RIS71_1578 [Actinomycetota bacterium]
MSSKEKSKAPKAGEKITGAQALIRALEMENVDVMFGLPGGCILPAYDPLIESPIRHILVRHEQGSATSSFATNRVLVTWLRDTHTSLVDRVSPW